MKAAHSKADTMLDIIELEFESYVKAAHSKARRLFRPRGESLRAM